MTALLLFALLTTAAYYVVSWAVITRQIDEILPPSLLSMLRCPACSGFWYGLAACALGAALNMSFLGLSCRSWYTFPIVALASLVWTPLVAAVHLRAQVYVADLFDSRTEEQDAGTVP